MLKILLVTSTLVMLLSSFSMLMFSSKPPEGYTGANGVTCNACHQGNPLNNAGGSVMVNGLPTGNYIAGATYNFSITISHAVQDRKRWGFEIAARNKLNQAIGTFTTTNPNAAINGKELSHNSAIVTPDQLSYTYTNLSWTAPAIPAATDDTIRFYYAGNAANGSGNSNDFIYNGSSLASYAQVYTFTGTGNWNDPANWSNNVIPPALLTGNAEILIDPAGDGECVLNISQTVTGGAKITVQPGKNFRIAGSLDIK